MQRDNKIRETGVVKGKKKSWEEDQPAVHPGDKFGVGPERAKISTLSKARGRVSCQSYWCTVRVRAHVREACRKYIWAGCIAPLLYDERAQLIRSSISIAYVQSCLYLMIVAMNAEDDVIIHYHMPTACILPKDRWRDRTS